MGDPINKEKKIFFNHSFDKKRLKALISWIFKQSGEAEALKVVDLLKETGFRYATKAGISIGLHDLTTPIQKSWLISESQLAISTTDRDFSCAKITATERSQRIIDTWHRASESLSKQVVDYFGIYDRFNPVYIMALSGARGNFSQVRQLIGMRGLMADQQGKIVSFPIRSNLREGLTLTEYFISCSGARKGLVDTALRTADTGYLTRRLVDVSHHVVVKRIRCNTNRGIVFKSLQSYNKIALSLKERLVGRVLAENIFQPSRAQTAKELLAKKDREISLKLSLKITEVRDKVYLRSPLTCGFTHSVCQLCYGWSISQGTLVALGDAVGVIAAQSIGEPGTQLTMRTFHTGGVFSGDLLQEIRAPHAGKVEFSKAFQGLLIRTAHGRIAFLSKTEGHIILSYDREITFPKENREKKVFCKKNVFAPTEHKAFTPSLIESVKKEPSSTTIPIPPFTMLFIRQGEKVENNQLLAEFSIRTKEGNQPIKTQQTIFALLSGRVIEDCSGKVYTKTIKESALSLDALRDKKTPSISCKASYKSSCKASCIEGVRRRQERVARTSTSCLKARREVKRFMSKEVPVRTNLLTRGKGCYTEGEYAHGCAHLHCSYGASSTCAMFCVAKQSATLRFVRREVRHAHGKRGKKKEEKTCKKSCASARTCNVNKSLICVARSASKGEQSKRKRSFATYKSLIRKKGMDSKICKATKMIEYPCSYKASYLSCPCPCPPGKSKGKSKGCAYAHGCAHLLTSTNLRFVRREVRHAHGKRGTGTGTGTCTHTCKTICSRSLANPFFPKEAEIKDSKKSFGSGVTAENKFLIAGRALKNRSFSICKAKLLSSYKSEDLENDLFRFIEPITSGRLGFLKILATRVGANLDYISPVKSFNGHFIKRSKIYTFMQASKTELWGKGCAHLLTSTCACATLRFVRREVRHAHGKGKRGTGTGTCKKRGTCLRAKDAKTSISQRKVRREIPVRYAPTCRALCIQSPVYKSCMATSLQFGFSNYLHPEVIKENRFFLQTIAEYGDIVDETYKKTRLL